jgi:hypothetical protein
MSGAVAVHSAYNGTGTQGLAVTNTLSNDENTVSVFWNRHDTTKQLLHGASLVEVVSSGAFGGAPSFGGSKIFNVNNDIDLISDLYLHFDFGISAEFTPLPAPLGDGATVALSNRRVLDFELINNYQFAVIDRVDFMVGTQIWHTLSGYDIRVLTGSFCIPGNSEKMSKAVSRQMFEGLGRTFPAVTVDEKAFSAGFGAAAGSSAPEKTNVTSVVWIPGLTATLAGQMRKFADITENGYIQAAAPQQQIKIKVTFNTGGAGIDRLPENKIICVGTDATAEGGAGGPQNTLQPTTIRAVGATSGDTINTLPQYKADHLTAAGEDEAGNIPNKGELIIDGPSGITGAPEDMRHIFPFKNIAIGYAGVPPTGAPTSISPALLNMRVTLDNVRLFAKQIMFTKEERMQIRNIPAGIPWKTKMSQSVFTSVTNGEDVKTLDLDSFSLYTSHLILRGILPGTYVKEVELKLNSSSFAGTLPAILLKNHGSQSISIYSGSDYTVNKHTGKAQFADNDMHEVKDLIIPLAGTVFSGSSVPLNRFDSIRLIVKFFGPTNQAGGWLNVTCVGETTTLYKGGSATLAMY